MIRNRMALLGALLVAALPVRAMYGLQAPQTYYQYGDLQWQGNGVIVQDVNHDGLDDAVLAYYDWNDSQSHVAVFPQTPATHALGAPISHAVVPNDWGSVYVASIENADLNGDGVDDVVVGHTAGVSILDPEAGFVPEALIENRSGYSNDWYIARSGDIDGDGDRDIVLFIANTQYPSLWIYRNDGAAHFDAGNTLPLPSICCFRDLRVLDLNGDGHQDLLLYSASMPGYFRGSFGFWVYANKGSGVFGGGPTPVVSDSTFDGGMATGDLDGDGAIDLVSWSGVTVPFPAMYGIRAYFHGRLGTPYRLMHRTWRAGSYAVSGAPLVHDMDGDGRQDLLYRESTFVLNEEETSYLCYIEYAPSGESSVYRYPYPCVGGTDGLAVGDINGDGVLDVVGANQDLGLGWALGANSEGIVNLVVGEGLSPGTAAFNLKNGSTTAVIAAPSVEITYSVNRGKIELADWPQECSRPDSQKLRLVCNYPDLAAGQSASGIVHYVVLQSQPYMQLHVTAKASTATKETMTSDNTATAATWIRQL